MLQPVGTFGNSGRFNLAGSGFWNLDIGMSRLLKVRERFNLEARAGAFNILNHANWNNPTVGINSSLFGQITSWSAPGYLAATLCELARANMELNRSVASFFWS